MTLPPFFDHLEDWIALFFHQQPLIGPFVLLILEEAGVPLPIPGDLFIAYAGYQVALGRVPYFVAFITLMIAVFIGSTILYILSYHYGDALVRRFGKYIHLHEKRLDYIEAKFRKYGAWVIIFGRHIPGFRIPITIFAGISRQKYRTFIISEGVSIIIWIAFFMQVGRKLGRQTLMLLHNKHSILFIIIMPITLALIMYVISKFIPDRNTKKIKKT